MEEGTGGMEHDSVETGSRMAGSGLYTRPRRDTVGSVAGAFRGTASCCSRTGAGRARRGGVTALVEVGTPGNDNRPIPPRRWRGSERSVTSQPAGMEHDSVETGSR